MINRRGENEKENQQESSSTFLFDENGRLRIQRLQALENHLVNIAF